jgi:hypothetical protein
MVALGLAEASVKVREGGPFHEPDEDEGIWAGVVPLTASWGTPLTAPEISVDAPAHVTRLEGRPVRGRRS